MSIIQAIILAIIEGLTEFLPVSSTGHMIIASSAMGIASHPFTKLFTVAIQFGAIVSVIVLYWKRFIPGKSIAETFQFYLKLLVAFLPAAIIGFLFDDYIDALLERVDVVGYALVLGGFIFLYLDAIFKKNESETREEISYGQGLKIGLFQTIAMIPGVSRSAATIIGGLTQGLNKRTAAEFSFFLAVPTMFAATSYKLLKFYLDEGTVSSHEMVLLGVGNIVAFVVAWLAIKSFITFLTRHGFRIFGIYRIVVGGIILVLYYLGVGLTIV
ncbi:MAG TPA: undecaprenyl-diphosphate phosphatase [Chryseolinea sp.]|nr:undecaprenyl-diphosphate phosphatase [Chryseolinea sp.]